MVIADIKRYVIFAGRKYPIILSNTRINYKIFFVSDPKSDFVGRK